MWEGHPTICLQYRGPGHNPGSFFDCVGKVAPIAVFADSQFPLIPTDGVFSGIGIFHPLQPGPFLGPRFCRLLGRPEIRLVPPFLLRPETPETQISPVYTSAPHSATMWTKIRFTSQKSQKSRPARRLFQRPFCAFYVSFSVVLALNWPEMARKGHFRGHLITSSQQPEKTAS